MSINTIITGAHILPPEKLIEATVSQKKIATVATIALSEGQIDFYKKSLLPMLQSEISVLQDTKKSLSRHVDPVIPCRSSVGKDAQYKMASATSRSIEGSTSVNGKEVKCSPIKEGVKKVLIGLSILLGAAAILFFLPHLGFLAVFAGFAVAIPTLIMAAIDLKNGYDIDKEDIRIEKYNKVDQLLKEAQERYKLFLERTPSQVSEPIIL